MCPPLASRQRNGGSTGSGCEEERRDVAVQVVDGDERQAARPRERLRRLEPDEQRADQARPLRDRDAVESSSVAPASPSASRTTGTTSSRWRATRAPGTTPPYGACSSACEATTFDRIAPVVVTTAAAVSSQDVSIPRISGSAALSSRVAPHDQRVFAVVGVVAAPNAAGDETELLVQRDRVEVRDPDLERVATAVFRAVSSNSRSAAATRFLGAGKSGSTATFITCHAST